ncbi:hypothetical protein T02_3243 [Trichinella nativa]|uniref:Uncharacterized protein n=2 Tax=Trichinella nativa TaxID=6335 RepID=A0A0V1KKQ8_9BILA|nr:hypothetical protein T02_3243 [Trichinella nativa]
MNPDHVAAFTTVIAHCQAFKIFYNGRDVIVPLARGCAEFSYQGSNPEMKRKNRGAVPLCRALKQKLKFIHQDLGRPQIRDSFLQ